ncbi:MAG: hypothetical protein ACU0CO_02170 [Shimia sp.]
MALLKPVFTRRHGDITFLARHRVTDALAGDLVSGLGSDWRAVRPFAIMVGIHHRPPRDTRPTLGIQTEHFRDAEGRPLWGDGKARRRAMRHLARYDHVLDMSAANRPCYPPGAPVGFGPYLFPDAPARHVPGADPRPVFFGAATDRRGALLARLGDGVVAVPPGTFGDALARAVAPHAAILNLHAAEGTYTEVPRLVAAYRSGKPLVSEPLSPDIVPERHYLPLDKLGTSWDPAAMFYAFATEIAHPHRFSAFLAARGLVRRI